RGNGASGFSVEPWALFLWSETRTRPGKDGYVGARVKEIHRGRGLARGGAGVRGLRRSADGRSEVLRPARHLAARLAADPHVQRRRLRRGPRVRRLLDPRLAG